MSNILYCGHCAVRLKPFKTGQDICTFRDDGSPYNLHSSDIYECPQCLNKTILANAQSFKHLTDEQDPPENTISVFDSQKQKNTRLDMLQDRVDKLQDWDDIDTNGRQTV